MFINDAMRPGALSAYFLTVEFDDPNEELSDTALTARKEEAETFLNAWPCLKESINELPEGVDDTEAQKIFYDIGKRFFGEDGAKLRRFFSLIYMLLFTNINGPRLGIFLRLYGRAEFISKIEERLNNPFNL